MSDIIEVFDSDDKRTKTAKELVNTEIQYVQHLNDIVEGYVKPLRNTGMLAAKTISAIFSNVETLLNFHMTFMAGLHGRVSEWGDRQILSDIFLELLPYLKLYTQYCMNYDNAIAVLQREKETNRPFEMFLQRTQQSSRFKGAYITTNLIRPIQRIPRYEMLLTEIIKLTPSEHVDYEALKRCLVQVKEIADFVNQECIKAENTQTLIAIAGELGMPQDRMCNAHRQLIKRGFVKIDGQPTSSSMFLLSDLLAFTMIRSRKDKFAPYVALELHLCWGFQDGPEIMQLATVGKTYSLKFDNTAERDEWLLKIHIAIEHLIDGKSDLSEKRQQYSLMKINQIYTVTSLTDGETAKKGRRASTSSTSWLAQRTLTIRRKREPLVEKPEDNNANLSPQRASTLLHTADISAILREAIPEVEVGKKRRSMPHMSMRKIVLAKQPKQPGESLDPTDGMPISSEPRKTASASQPSTSIRPTM